MFDFQDERELENKKEKIKQYYTNWLQKGSLSEIAKAYDSLVKQHAEQRKMIDEIIDFTEKFYDGNHNPLSTKTRLTEILAKYGYDVK
jgi:RNA polymerase-interacting CarD/CdnL/TRCF family regulator